MPDLAGGGSHWQTLMESALVTSPRAMFDRAALLTQGINIVGESSGE
jgi:hypothetical protein